MTDPTARQNRLEYLEVAPLRDQELLRSVLLIFLIVTLVSLPWQIAGIVNWEDNATAIDERLADALVTGGELLVLSGGFGLLMGAWRLTNLLWVGLWALISRDVLNGLYVYVRQMMPTAPFAGLVYELTWAVQNVGMALVVLLLLRDVTRPVRTPRALRAALWATFIFAVALPLHAILFYLRDPTQLSAFHFPQTLRAAQECLRDHWILVLGTPLSLLVVAGGAALLKRTAHGRLLKTMLWLNLGVAVAYSVVQISLNCLLSPRPTMLNQFVEISCYTLVWQSYAPMAAILLMLHHRRAALADVSP